MSIFHRLRLPVPEGARCAACGYSLRGLRQGGSCPECGHSILESLEASARHESPLLYRGPMIYCGMVAATCAFAAAVILSPARPPHGLWQIAFLLSVLMAIVGFTRLMMSPWCRYPLVWMAFAAAFATAAALVNLRP